MKLDWLPEWNLIGNNFGYSVHQKQMKKFLKKAGVEMVKGSKIRIDVTTPWYFRPEKDKFNVLFTMFEGDNPPQCWIEKMNQADLIIVPCQHNYDIFRPIINKSVPIEICNEGVDSNKYTYIKREMPKNNPFTFLWVGASNPRKGIAHIRVLWECWNKLYPELAKNTELILKTTQEGKIQEQTRLRTPYGDNLIVDTRILPENELLGLYKYANCFLFPTLGEGWGLTLAEAQATGMPCIYTNYSGVNDFMSPEYAWPIKHDMDELEIYDFDDSDTDAEHYIYYKTAMANPKVDDMLDSMVYIYKNYDEALKKAKRGAMRLHTEFTWNQAADRFIEIIEKHTGEKNVKKTA